MAKRYSVLTYIFGYYECLHEIEGKDPEADYVLVTDRDDLRSDTWRIVTDRLDGMTAMEKCYYVRYHPFKYVDTEYVIRLDASIAIYRPLGMFIDKMQEGDYDRCLMIHPFRNSIYEEYMIWAERKGYPEAQARAGIELLKIYGYDFSYRGLFQMSFEVVRDNIVNGQINDITYTLMRHVSLDGTIDRVDQTMTSFVINRFFSDRLKVLPVSQDIICRSSLMQWFNHNSSRPRRWKVFVPPVMFNKPCEIWNP